MGNDVYTKESLKELLENDDEYFIVFSEPHPGLDKEGNEITTNRTIFVTLKNAVEQARFSLRTKNVKLSDEELLDFFIINSYGRIIKL